MRTFKLERVQVLPITIDQAWEFFSNPLNLSDITPPDLGLQIKGQYSGKIYNGMMIEYSVKPLYGISLPWVSEIKHVFEPYCFVDEQRVGPYQFWYHQHFFKEIDSSVEVRDVVYYALGLGPVSGLINDCVVSRRLDDIFKYRQKVLDEKFHA